MAEPQERLVSAQEAESLHQQATESWLGDLELAMREARRGNPLEFVRLQWPALLLPEYDRPYFQSDLRLDDAQLDILTHVFAEDHTECFIKGCTGYGKGFITALCVNIWFDVFPDSKVILTGPSVDHVVDTMFAEVVNLRRQMVYAGDGEIQSDRIISKTNRKHVVTIANPKTGEGFSGQHTAHTLVAFDEASATPDLYYDMACKFARFIIALSNPRILSGWFRKGFGEHNPDECKSVPGGGGNRRLVTASGSKTVNVRHRRLAKPFVPLFAGDMEIGGEIVRAGETVPQYLRKYIAPLIPAQIDYSRYLQIMAHPDEMHRLVFGEGLFPREDPQLQVILGSWVDLAVGHWSSEIPVEAFGLDVSASEDGDSTVLASGSRAGCLCLREQRRANVMETTGWVLRTISDEFGIDLTNGQNPIVIDYGGGYGRGVGDRLREQGCRVIGAIPNARSRMPHLYENIRAEMYGELGKRMNPGGQYETTWALPPNEPLLYDELTVQEKIIASDGIKFRLIPKDKAPHGGKTVKDRLDRSPDRSDAVALLWRAVSLGESTQDYSKRRLVHVFGEEEKDETPENPAERAAWERNRHIQELCERMDERHDAALALW